MKSAIEWNNEGLEQYNSKNFSAALVAFQKAIDLDDSNAFFWKNIGDCLYDMQKKEEAIRSYEKAIILDKNATPSIFLDFGIILFSEKQYTRALKQLLRAESHPNLPPNLYSELHTWLSDTYYELGEFSQALRHLRRTSKTDANYQKSPAEILKFFKIYIGMNDFHQGINEIRQGMVLYPDNEAMLYHLMDLYKEHNMYGTLEDIFISKKENFKHDPNFWMRILSVRIKFEDYKKFENDCDEMLQHTDDDETVQYVQEIKRNAIKNLHDLEAVVSEPFNAELYQNSEENYHLKEAIGHFLLHEFRKAHDYLVRYLKIQQQSQGGVFLMGILKIFVNDFEIASKFLKFSAEFNPEYSIPDLGLAYCSYKNHNIDEMWEQWRKLCEKDEFWKAFDPEIYFGKDAVRYDLFGNALVFVQKIGEKSQK